MRRFALMFLSPLGERLGEGALDPGKSAFREGRLSPSLNLSPKGERRMTDEDGAIPRERNLS